MLRDWLDESFRERFSENLGDLLDGVIGQRLVKGLGLLKADEFTTGAVSSFCSMGLKILNYMPVLGQLL